MKKICSRCHIEKDFSEFNKSRHRKIGIEPHCRVCNKKREQKYMSTEHGQLVRSNNNKKRYAENKEELLAKGKKWREENKEYLKAHQAEYRKNRDGRDPENYRKWTSEYKKKKYRSNPKHRLQQLIGRGIRRSLKDGEKGQKHWEDLVGYTAEDLLIHLKRTLPSGYSWDDYVEGNTDLHIDHIVPVSAYNFSNPDHTDFKRCWSLSNLRLLPCLKNIKKSNKLDKPFQPCLQL